MSILRKNSFHGIGPRRQCSPTPIFKLRLFYPYFCEIKNEGITIVKIKYKNWTEKFKIWRKYGKTNKIAGCFTISQMF